MKKFFILMAAICFAVSFSANNGFARDRGIDFKILAGIDVFGEGTLEGDVMGFEIDEDEDVKVGFTPGAEVLFTIIKPVSIGAGFRYQVPREIDMDEKVEFSFIPIYAIAQWNLPFPVFTPSLVLHLGYNFLDADLDELEDDWGIDLDTKNGFYWGIGASVMTPVNVFVEILYSINYGKLEAPDYDEEVDLNYSKLTLSVGYRF